MTEALRLLRHRTWPGLERLAVYRSVGGYEALRRAVTETTPQEVIATVRASGLRGRGGAGFPTGVKWSLVPQGSTDAVLVVNADESEPGAFKDHELLVANPHQVLEGAAIAAVAIGAQQVFVYCRGEFWHSSAVLRRAIDEATAAGFLGEHLFGTDRSLVVTVVHGAGAYICGEETALLESLEGKRGEPRLKPPYPTQVGLFGRPTVVNNVETLANVPLILAHGAEWFRSLGTETSPGTKIYSLSGHVERPGNYEAPLGTPFGELLEQAGGVWRGRRLKAVLPSGVSAAVLPAGEVQDLALDWESVAARGSHLGSGSLIVLDDHTDMVWVTEKIVQFFEHESCGKCTPCREGTYWLRHLLRRLRQRQAGTTDLATLDDVLRQMMGRCFCPLGESAAEVGASMLRHYRAEFERHLKPIEETAA